MKKSKGRPLGSRDQRTRALGQPHDAPYQDPMRNKYVCEGNSSGCEVQAAGSPSLGMPELGEENASGVSHSTLQPGLPRVNSGYWMLMKRHASGCPAVIGALAAKECMSQERACCVVQKGV